MISTSGIQLFSYVTFSLYGSATLGNGYTNVKVLGIIDGDTAGLFAPVATIHADIYPLLPAGTPSDFNAYPYLKLGLNDGSVTAIGLPWIVDASFVVSQNRTMTITLPSLTPDDQNRVTAALSAIGMKNFTVSLQ